MASLFSGSIQDSDQILVHRDGVDYRTPFSRVLDSLPDGGGSVVLPGVLTYKGIAAAHGGEPPRNVGDIWLLLVENTIGGLDSWIPDGAANSDYLTYAEDTKGVFAWRQIGNAAGIDFDEFQTKEDAAKTRYELLTAIDKKADKDSLGDQEQIQKNLNKLLYIEEELERVNQASIEGDQSLDGAIQGLNNNVRDLGIRIGQLEASDKFSVGALEMLTN